MNKTAMQTMATPELLTETQESTNTSFLTTLPSVATVPTFQELFEEYQASVAKRADVWNPFTGNESHQPASTNVHPAQTLAVAADLAMASDLASASDPASAPDLASASDPTSASGTAPFAIYETNLTNATPQPVDWLWRKRLPLGGIIPLDGDHGTGKSILASRLAASVSSGTTMSDGTPIIQGGVVIITPHTDANNTQLQRLIALGADPSKIVILSYIKDPETASHSSGYRPISLPQDLPRILEAVDRVKARLLIFDPFISLLSPEIRWTDQRLGHLLADLNQHLIERNVACLITHNCHAKGGLARPSALERSKHFSNIAVSRLLLAPDPMHPDRLLLSHVQSHHSALTCTLILQIQSQSDNPDLPHITTLGTHNLQAKDLLNSRPDTLHRQLLSKHLLQTITETTDPIPIATSTLVMTIFPFFKSDAL